ncbi:MAG: SDR family oxidoreductase [Candidatus Jettenia caeni]|nr:MAG: SDR family oxidoreductase [Candidatus Jettenia sp. AMX1]MCE7881450.1 SDR family oxidoreductase [Candidatus Jettenia sp. AMX1]MCQ3928006.1 SDR family NAD(P)-dependent oxidoreductase [Candidatus Jettenia sp.]NUN22313.1 SDR family oxidoreductase [Candidatus Jettenia caeni]GJQ45081.1 MAG: short-chain dehydrogenase [Candidatus Jettenia caeni]
MNELKGNVALVTGGGRGLGEAICRMLGESGATVVLTDIREELVKKIADDLRIKSIESMALPLDVGDEQQAEEAVNQVVARYGHLDILINNAGIDVTLPVDEISVADWDRIIRVNLRGPFLMSKYALSVMKQRGRGNIVNIVSTAAKRTWANASAYHASKWGLLGFSHALHVEARKQNIKVIAVISGGMRTPFLLERFPDIDLNTLQEPKNVAGTVKFVLMLPDETVIPEVMVLPMHETSWP